MAITFGQDFNQSIYFDRGETPALKKRLDLLSLMGSQGQSEFLPVLYKDLQKMVKETVAGSRVEQVKLNGRGFQSQSIEVKDGSGELLGQLYMVYLKKPIRCYYLVYVEVGPHFRRQGLGTRILQYFRYFLDAKAAVGILDNVIPEDDPTFSIYEKQGWQDVENIIQNNGWNNGVRYMIYMPDSCKGKVTSTALVRLLTHLDRKRTAMGMRENELMVKKTLGEFKDVLGALLEYFAVDFKQGKPTPLARYMFTRFAVKLVSFSSQISRLVGYTGGESLAQISFPKAVLDLPLQACPFFTKPDDYEVNGDSELFNFLPSAFKNNPAQAIEKLPCYGRPSFTAWLKKKRKKQDNLTIADLLELGFDPTRLKFIKINGEKYVFERIDLGLEELAERQALLNQLAGKLKDVRLNGGTKVIVNPILLTIRGAGNIYVLRRMISGIHFDEALEQIKTNSALATLCQELNLKAKIVSAVKEVDKILAQEAEGGVDLIKFVPWNLTQNRPQIQVDLAGINLEWVCVV